MDNRRIVEAALERTIDNGLIGEYPNGDSPQCGNVRIVMKLDDGSVEYLEYYSDEIHISPEEVVGMSVSEAHNVKRIKDLEYLRS